MKQAIFRCLTALFALVLLGVGCDDNDDDNAAADGGTDADADADADADDEYPLIDCMVERCEDSLNTCMANETCAAALSCTGRCQNPDQELLEACQIDCTVTHKSSLIDDLFACSNAEGCFTRPDWTCPTPTNELQFADVDLGTLNGVWYVVRGLNRTYDCWSCQQMSFNYIDVNSSHYFYDFTVTSGAWDTIECTTRGIPHDPAVPINTPGRFQVDYLTSGLPGQDDWYVLADVADQYLLLYYCGTSPMSVYRGAVVMSRIPSTEISPDAINIFNTAFASAGLDNAPAMDEFCVPDNSACQE